MPEYLCYGESLRADDYTVSDVLPAGTISSEEMHSYLSHLTGNRGCWSCKSGQSVFTISDATITLVPGSADTLPGYVLDIPAESRKHPAVHEIVFTPVCKKDDLGRCEIVGFVSTGVFLEYFLPFTAPADYDALKARVSEYGAYAPLPIEDWEFIHGDDPELFASMAFLDAPFNTPEGMLILACLAPDECLSPDPDDVAHVPECVWSELSERFGVPLMSSEDADPDESVFPEDPRAFLINCLATTKNTPQKRKESDRCLYPPLRSQPISATAPRHTKT